MTGLYYTLVIYNIKGMKREGRRSVVTSFIRREGKILIVRRSNKVGSYRGKWSAISGYLEEEEPLVQAIKEIEEETGIIKEKLTFVRKGEPLLVLDGEREWLVHPFLFEVEGGVEVKLDWENIEHRWIDPEELDSFDTVPSLKETYDRVK